MVENFPSKAADMGSIPGQGTKIPGVPGQLSPPERPAHHNKDPAQPKFKRKKKEAGRAGQGGGRGCF